jgi:hypothetical protein
MLGRRLIVFLVGIPAIAQSIGAHFMGGIPVSEFNNLCCFVRFSYAQVFTNRYAAGAGMEVRLPKNLGIEADVIYQRAHLTAQCCVQTLLDSALRVSGNSLQVPVLLKYRLINRRFTPYLMAGPSIRWISFSGEVVHFFPGTTRQPFHGRTESAAGFTVGGWDRTKSTTRQVALRGPIQPIRRHSM